MSVLWDNGVEGSGLTQHYVGTREAARLLGVSRDGIHNYARRGKITVIRTALGNLVSRQEILSLRGETDLCDMT